MMLVNQSKRQTPGKSVVHEAVGLLKGPEPDWARAETRGLTLGA